MSRARSATVRYYFDADVLGLAHVVAGLRPDCTYPGDPGATVWKRVRPACIITDPGTDDDVWIPQVAAQGWVIITRDSRIQQHRREIDAVRDSGARMVALSGAEARGTWAQLAVVMSQWHAIEDLEGARRVGPWIYTATRTSLQEVALS